MALSFCSWWCCVQTDERLAWEFAVHSVLSEERHQLDFSAEFCEALLRNDAQDEELCPALDVEDFDLSGLQFRGLPTRPLYKVVAFRLYLLRLRLVQAQSSDLVGTFQNISRPWIPAEHFGFKEEETDMLWKSAPPARPARSEILTWFRQAGHRVIFELLGFRQTVGTDSGGLLPPSWTCLCQAANQRHKTHAVLSVAARARAKHAHRCQHGFFGVAHGSPTQQNQETLAILIRILKDAAWINIHTFGGVSGPVLEIRVSEGYGARWTADWSDPYQPSNVVFRGFLEPQMQDGHRRGWKH